MMRGGRGLNASNHHIDHGAATRVTRRAARWRRPLTAALLLVAIAASAVPAQSPDPGPAPRPRRPPRVEGPQREADLVLVGVIVRENGPPIAVIEDRRTRKQTLYKPGALVRGGRVTTVLEDKVILTFADGEVELRLATSPSPTSEPAPRPAPPPVVVVEPSAVPSSAPVAPVGDQTGHFQRIDRATFDGFLAAPDIVSGFTAIDGGVKISAVRGSGLFQALGLRQGDVVRTINGTVPGAKAPLGQMIQDAARTGMVRFELMRDGKVDVKYVQIDR